MVDWPSRNGRTALITGITGQDGSYLAEFLLAKGYEVWGTLRRSSSFNTGRIDHIYQDPHDPDVRLRLVYSELGDSSAINHLIRTCQPDEIYNLGAQSHVKVSFDIPEYTGDIVGLGALRVLEAVRDSGLECRFYQASSSEIFGKVQETPQSETTPLCPRSPYAAAKVYAYHMTRNYREAYGTFASNGILFNHESPRRGETFVTRKVTRAVAAIKLGRERPLHLGNLDAERDWGFAGDYVEAMWLMLQQDEPDDFVVGTGEKHSVREFCEVAFSIAGMPLEWKGKGADEIGVGADGRVLVRVDDRYFRPAEVETLLADPRKAREELGWEATVRFKDLVEMMVLSDLQAATAGVSRTT